MFVCLFILAAEGRKGKGSNSSIRIQPRKGGATFLSVPMIMTSASAEALLTLFSGKKYLDPGSDI